jgi:hypothetical protein
MKVQLAAGKPDPVPPIATPTPASQPVRISFPPGGTTASVTGSLGEMGQGVYVLRALANQLMDMQVDTVGGRC